MVHFMNITEDKLWGVCVYLWLSVKAHMCRPVGCLVSLTVHFSNMESFGINLFKLKYRPRTDCFTFNRHAATVSAGNIYLQYKLSCTCNGWFTH